MHSNMLQVSRIGSILLASAIEDATQANNQPFAFCRSSLVYILYQSPVSCSARIASQACGGSARQS